MYYDDIEQTTLDNEYYRKIVHSEPDMQIILMAIPPLREVGMESHEVPQFLRIEQGDGVVVINNYNLVIHDGMAVKIPSQIDHNIINTSKTKTLKLYTIYGGMVHQTDANTIEQALHESGHDDIRNYFPKRQ